MSSTPVIPHDERGAERHNPYRFHLPSMHLGPAFGDDWFGHRAEMFARFFGTPLFLITQSVLVLGWIWLNMSGHAGFDPCPFILLNLAFSLQAAYAAPLILLAQTRQADRDKAHSEADAHHREDLALAAQERVGIVAQQTAHLLELLEQNTRLTEMVRVLGERTEALTREIHGKVVRAGHG